MIIDSFDNSKPLFTPKDVIEKIEYKCDICIAAYSRHVVEHVLEKYEHEEIGHIGSCNGNLPIYYLKELNILFFMSPITSAFAGVSLQELSYITGASKFIYFGSCGILDKKYKGKIIIPNMSYRDEGLSYHYIKPSDYIEIKNHKRIEEILNKNGIDYVVGKSWTTDAIYRETVNNIEKRRKDGCISVEMESSGLQAVSDYLGIDFYTFFLTGDLLEEDWKREDLGGLKERNKQISAFDIALLIAKNI